jgi:hypothetical protein
MNSIIFYQNLTDAHLAEFMHNAPKMRAYEKKDYEIDLWFSQEQYKIDMAKIEKNQDAITAKKEFNASIIINNFLLKCYWSPHTNIGKKRFYRSIEDLYDENSDYHSADEE